MKTEPETLPPLSRCKVGFPVLPEHFNRSFYVAVCFFILLVGVLLISVLWANQGTLSFVLDDPLIHLRLAENIWLGHYGINPNEASAPASSILWPYILAPFASAAYALWLVLLLNIGLAFGVIYFIAACLALCLSRLSSRYMSLVLCGFIALANLPALVFVGMEHVLQVLLAVMEFKATDLRL